MNAFVASVDWTPSAARTAVVVEPPGLQLRGVTVAPLPLTWPVKAPVEQLDYSLDLTQWLADSDDQLLTASATVSPAAAATDLGIVWCSIINGDVVVFLGGGTENTTYVVLVSIQSAEGRVAVFPVSLTVSNMTPSATPPAAIAAPPNAVASSAGLLTFDTGSLLLLS